MDSTQADDTTLALNDAVSCEICDTRLPRRAARVVIGWQAEHDLPDGDIQVTRAEELVGLCPSCWSAHRGPLERGIGDAVATLHDDHLIDAGLGEGRLPSWATTVLGGLVFVLGLPSLALHALAALASLPAHAVMGAGLLADGYTVREVMAELFHSEG